jgi:chromate reductase
MSAPILETQGELANFYVGYSKRTPYRSAVMTTLLAFSGSLRKDSFNTRVLRALPALAPAGTQIALFDIADLPMYNQDLDGETVPEIVAALRAAIAEADGVIIDGPEYSGSYSGATKNLIDWASRPFMAGPIIGKTSMVIATTPGPGGGKNVLPATSALLQALGGKVVAQVGAAAIHEKLAADSDTIIDEEFAQQLREGLAAF